MHKSYSAYCKCEILDSIHKLTNDIGDIAKKGKAQLIVGLVGGLCCCFPLWIVNLITAIKDVATVKQ